MLKKTITYKNLFTNEEIREEHYFHISKADLIKMQMEEHATTYVNKDGETLSGMQAKLQRIVDSEDGNAILKELEDLVRRSYGKKDGDRFLKSKEIWDNFASTEAYSQLIFDLCMNADVAAEFTTGIIPGDLEQIAAEVQAEVAKAQTASASPSGDKPEIAAEPRDPTATEPRLLTRVEAIQMESDELQSGLATGRYRLS